MDDDSKPVTSFSTGSTARPSPKLLGRANFNLQARSEEPRSTPEPTARAEEVVLDWGDGTRVIADHMELHLSEENAEANGADESSSTSIRCSFVRTKGESDRIVSNFPVPFRSTRGNSGNAYRPDPSRGRYSATGRKRPFTAKR